MNAMETSLVIVESPSKARTIKKYLGKGFEVEASVGHIIDLPKSKFGVNIEDGFKPQYIKIRGKEKIIKQLNVHARKASKVYLATDPDREGEAIAYHIASILDKEKQEIHRIEFNEITKNAVTRAIESPRSIDMARVYSQQARRVLDRIVGYQVSPLLWKTVYRGLSAGRVQSVALRLICEREKSIRDFVEEEFWTIRVLVKGQPENPFWVKLIRIRDKSKKSFVKAEIKNEREAKGHVEAIKASSLSITELVRKQVNKQPVPPFITSTLQQTAARLFRFSTSRIMTIAQQLYEGVEIPGKGSIGLISYMRTDSFRISKEALQGARHYVKDNFGEDYLHEKERVFKSKKSAQDAHEAIRPTYLTAEFSPQALQKHLNRDQFKLYDLIWKRFIATQMKAAVFEKTTVDVAGGDYLFRAEGETMVFDGYLKVYGQGMDNEESDNEDENGGMRDGMIPAGLQQGESLTQKKQDAQQNFTKPPARYSESTLVKELDKQGIGRPSTYAQIITTIIKRKYVEKKENKLFATDLGETVNDILIKNFPDIFNVKFTAEMENELDCIANKECDYKKVMHDFYTPFHQAMESVNSKKEEIKSDLQEEAGIICEQCGRPMVVRWGRNGRFIACSGYPECKNTKPLEEENQPKESGEICNKCGQPMVYKVGRFGRFLACSDYPKCKNTKAIPLGIKCPHADCNGDIIERRSRRGKVFYGCSNYPKCDFVSWNKPVNRSCPECGNNYLLEKYSKAKGNFLQCPECKYVMTPSKEESPV
jgi:DNA topoisomerase-1